MDCPTQEFSVTENSESVSCCLRFEFEHQNSKIDIIRIISILSKCYFIVGNPRNSMSRELRCNNLVTRKKHQIVI